MQFSQRALRAIERRKFLKLMGGAASGALALGSGGTFVRTRRAEAQGSLTPFVDPLPIPSVITPSGTLHGKPLFEVTMQPFTQQLHGDLPPTPLWGYNGLYPGPTFETRRGKPIYVQAG